MSFFRIVILFIGFIPSFVMSAPVPIDSSAFGGDDSASPFGIGMTVSSAQRPFVGVDDQVTSLPYFSYSKGSFYVEGIDVGFKAFGSKDYNLNFLITPRYYEVQPSFASNGELDGVDKTNQTFFAGLSYQYRTSLFNYHVQLIADVAESDGSEFNLSASKYFHVTTKLGITTSFGISYQDDKLVDHFYGVQANEVIAVTRPQYNGSSSLNKSFIMTAVYHVNTHFQLLGQMKAEFWDTGITDSPVVDENTTISYTMGGVYRF